MTFYCERVAYGKPENSKLGCANQAGSRYWTDVALTYFSAMISNSAIVKIVPFLREAIDLIVGA